MKTTIYTSDKRTNFFKELKDIYKDIRGSNFLAYQMTKRDIQSQHRQSLLGVFWILLPVLVNSFIWLFLNSSGVVSVSIPSNIPYPVYVVLGTTIWNIFTETIQSPILSVNQGKGILAKINFPKEALLMTGIYKIIFNFFIKIIPIMMIMIFYQMTPSYSILLFPIYILAILLFSFSLGLIIAPLGLIYTDISRLINVGIPFIMYLTPVVYSPPKTGFFKYLFDFNPLTYLITDARNSLLGLELENTIYIISLSIFSLFLLLIGLVIFRKSMPIVIEKIGG